MPTVIPPPPVKKGRLCVVACLRPLTLLLLGLLALFHPSNGFCAAAPFFIQLDLPTNWKVADASRLTGGERLMQAQGIQMGLIASTKRLFSPSIVVTLEQVGSHSLETYLDAVCNRYCQQKRLCYDRLEELSINGSPACLLYIRKETTWGKVALLQAIALHEGYALIQTASCSQDDFFDLLDRFKTTFLSLKTFASPWDSLSNSQEQADLHRRCDRLQQAWHRHAVERSGEGVDPNSLFADPAFQQESWSPFITYLQTRFQRQGIFWQTLVHTYMQTQLLESL